MWDSRDVAVVLSLYEDEPANYNHTHDVPTPRPHSNTLF